MDRRSDRLLEHCVLSGDNLNYPRAQRVSSMASPRWSWPECSMPTTVTRARRILVQRIWLAALLTLLAATPAFPQEQRPQPSANPAASSAPGRCTDLNGHELPCPV